MQRNWGIDHLRIALSYLVVFHHAAIAYGGSGGWYWREEENFSNLTLVAFNAINQSWFMGMFFLIAGYYSAAALGRKSSAQFAVDRVLRLGLPLVFYFFVLSPLTIALATSPGFSELGTAFIESLREQRFGVGPLWFAEALLIFSAVYLIIRKCLPLQKRDYALPSTLTLLIWTVVLALSAFFLRLYIPVGKTIASLQLGYFPAYIFLFYAGCVVWRGRLLENISFATALPWLLVSILGIATIPFALRGVLGNGAFEGGWNWNALYYAFWDSLIAWGIGLTALALSQRFARNEYIGRHFGACAYGVFIFHPPFLVALSRVFENIAINPVWKFFVVGVCCCALCTGFSWLIRRNVVIRKII